jgi:hypothetical protein
MAASEISRNHCASEASKMRNRRVLQTLPAWGTPAASTRRRKVPCARTGRGGQLRIYFAGLRGAYTGELPLILPGGHCVRPPCRRRPLWRPRQGRVAAHGMRPKKERPPYTGELLLIPPGGHCVRPPCRRRTMCWTACGQCAERRADNVLDGVRTICPSSRGGSLPASENEEFNLGVIQKSTMC